MAVRQTESPARQYCAVGKIKLRLIWRRLDYLNTSFRPQLQPDMKSQFFDRVTT